MAFNQTDINNLLTVLNNTSRTNPLTAIQIETALQLQFGFPTSGNQQRTRALIKHTIASGHLIKSSTANPAGFWLSNDRQEILTNFESLKEELLKLWKVRLG